MSFNYSKLNDLKHTFVIAEAGSNWKCGTYEQDFSRATELIDIAAQSGADAVKFQTYRAETVYVQGAGNSNYLSKSGIVQNINDIFETLSMPYEMLPELAKYCNEKKILFMSTPFSVCDAEQVNSCVSIHKVASYEINHVRLLEYLANTKKPIILSTGAATFEEIDFAIKLIKDNGNDKIALLQCTSKYPAPLESLNLSVIPKMKARYDIPIGLSDHSINPIIGPLMAIGFGATIVEKHFTLDRNLPGPDHKFALIPQELKLMIDSIRMADQTKGTGSKEILEDEMELRKFATRSIQAIKDISKGEILQEGVNFQVLRPGNRTRGLEARFLKAVIGKKAKTDIKMGEGITGYE